MQLRRPSFQFGCEKEFGLANLRKGRADELLLGATTIMKPDLVQQALAMEPNGLKPEARGKPFAAIRFSDMTPILAARYVKAWRAQSAKRAAPPISCGPGSPLAKIKTEPNGAFEFVSPVYDDVATALAFTKKFGWGHFHTSFDPRDDARTPEERIAWLVVANLWVFLGGLEGRKMDDPKSLMFPLAKAALKVPTEPHRKYWRSVLVDGVIDWTDFKKCLLVSLRTAKVYGGGRVGVESRGGVERHKRVVVASLMESVSGEPGAPRIDLGDFKLPDTTPRKNKAGTVPEQLIPLVQARAAELGLDVDAAAFLATLRRAGTPKPPDDAYSSWNPSLDERVCIPLLNYSALPFLTAAEKAQAAAATKTFIEAVRAEGHNVDGDRMALGMQIARHTIAWGAASGLAAPLRRMLGGSELPPPGQLPV